MLSAKRAKVFMSDVSQKAETVSDLGRSPDRERCPSEERVSRPRARESGPAQKGACAALAGLLRTSQRGKCQLRLIFGPIIVLVTAASIPEVNF